MTRLAQVLVLAVWIAGAAIGVLTVQSSPPSSANESLTLLLDTDYAHLGVDRTHVVLAVTTPWQSEWRMAAPRPKRLVQPRSEEAPSAPQSEAPVAQTVVCFFIRSLVPAP